jgi:hypothetical protein
MNKVARTIAYAGVLVASIAAAPSYALTQADRLGENVAATDMADRVINVDSGTRWVNVNYGETVRFIVKGANGEQDFAWHFDGIADPIQFSAIDPDAALGRDLKVYVNESTNPQYQSPSE